MLDQPLGRLLVFEAHMYGDPGQHHQIENEQAQEYDLPIEPGIGGIEHGLTLHGDIDGPFVAGGIDHNEQIHIKELIEIGVGHHRRLNALIHTVPAARVGIGHRPARQVFYAVGLRTVQAVPALNVCLHVVDGCVVLRYGGGVCEVED